MFVRATYTKTLSQPADRLDTGADDKKEESSPTTKVRVRRDRHQEVASQLGVGRPTPPFRP